MKRGEAIALLAACKPLTDRLTTQGVSRELSDTERVALEGFKRVADYEQGRWLENASVRSMAHIPKYKIGALYFATAMLVDEEMRRQCESGDQVD